MVVVNNLHTFLVSLCIFCTVLAGCSANRISGRSDPDKTAFSSRPHKANTRLKTNQFKQRNRARAADNRTRHFARTTAPAGRSAKSDAFLAKRSAGGRGHHGDAFSAPRRQRNARVDDCFTFRVKGHGHSASGKDAFASPRRTAGRGKYGDAFAGSRTGMFAKSFRENDAFSKRKRGFRRKNFIGERFALFGKREKRKKKHKGSETFTQSNKAKKRESESRQRAPELDLFRGRVLRKSIN